MEWYDDVEKNLEGEEGSPQPLPLKCPYCGAERTEDSTRYACGTTGLANGRFIKTC